MIPIHELLSRIYWDSEFGKGAFEIGYYDRMEQRAIRIPFEKVLLEKGSHATFQLMGANGKLRKIPLHRVREVYKNGDQIW